jgi:hypothetical protein
MSDRSLKGLLKGYADYNLSKKKLIKENLKLATLNTYINR